MEHWTPKVFHDIGEHAKRSRLSVELQWRDYYIRMGLRVSPPYRGRDAEAAYHAMRYEQLAFID